MPINNFSEEQKQVIFETNRNVLLIAPPGTGKTTTLTERISHILSDELAKPTEILCITFTNKAARDLKTKINMVLGANAKNLTINTIHGFCYHILQQESKLNNGIPSDFTVIDDEDSLAMLKELVLDELKLPYGDYLRNLKDFVYKVKHRRADYDFYTDFKGSISYSSNETETAINNRLEDYKKTIFKMYKTENVDFMEFAKTGNNPVNKELLYYLYNQGAELIMAYEDKLGLSHSLDFVDLVLLVYELFSTEFVLDKWKNKYKFVNIDEVQDTSFLEYRIISKLFTSNVLLSGDLNQTIYEWRGSSPQEIISDYKENFDPIAINFTNNFRSDGKLSDFWSVIRRDFLCDENFQFDNEINNGLVDCFSANDISSEARFIYDKIKHMVSNSDKTYKDFCILTRYNKYNTALSEEISKIEATENDELPYSFMLIEQFTLFKKPIVKNVLAFLKLAINPCDEPSFNRIITNYVKSGASHIKNINEELKQFGLSTVDFLPEHTYLYDEPFGLLLDNYKNNNIVVFDVETTGLNFVKDDIIQIAAIKIDNNGEVIDKFNKFILTDKNLSDTMHVHGFSNEFILENGEIPNKVFAEFSDFVKNSVIVGHNVHFDLNMLRNNLHRLGMQNIDIAGYYDTLNLFRRFYKGLSNYKLETLSTIFNIKSKPDHNAFNDILATSELLTVVINEHITHNVDARKSVVSKYKHLFSNIVPFINNLKKLVDSETSTNLIELVATKLGIINESIQLTLYDNKDAKTIKKQKNYSDITELMNSAASLVDSELSNFQNTYQLVSISTASTSELDVLLEKSKKIPIITVHQAKGLEFKVVFVAGLMQDIFPIFLSNNNIEERRLLYVAFTRAKEELILSYSSRFNYRNYTPSHFLSEFSQYVNIVK